MASYKTVVIEALFEARWDPAATEVGASDADVSLDDVAGAIEDYNRLHGTTYSTKNPANFFKDFIRKKAAANRAWPAAVLARGYTGKQLTGGGRCFRFEPLPPGQTEAFARRSCPRRRPLGCASRAPAYRWLPAGSGAPMRRGSPRSACV